MTELDFGIGFHSTIMGAGTMQGYGYAAVQLIEAWQRQMHPVWWGDIAAPIGFSFVQPQWYEYDNGNRINIGYTPWESDKVPEAWVPKMNKMTEIWTTSNACMEWFINAGVKRPVRVLHHGINRQHWPIRRRHWNRDTEPFRFLHVGGESRRKGAEFAYNAFAEAFADRTDVLLVLKARQLSFEPKLSNVYVVKEELSQTELTKLFLKCHAMIYPTQGEGFGLLPFQAAATAMPTLVTDWSGPKDYMQFCWPIKVNKLVETNYEPHVGLWAEPNMDDLLYKIKDIVDGHSYYFKSAHRKASQMDAEWSWDAIATKALNWMRQLLESPAC